MCGESIEKEIDSVMFRSYDKRLASFTHKWRGRLNPEKLARHGFYYLSVDDLCKCFYCGVEIFRWEYDDCPIEEHYRLCKDCDLNDCLKRCKTVLEKPSENNFSYIIFFVIVNMIISIYNLYRL